MRSIEKDFLHWDALEDFTGFVFRLGSLYGMRVRPHAATSVCGATSSYDADGARLTGSVPQTKRSYTGQYLDDTGLLFYNARYYDAGIGRFVSADSIVPGNASGGMAGVAYKPLTVDFHEVGFVNKLAQENQFGPWYTLSNQQRQQAGAPWGPGNPQALNRYAYVLNGPMKATDPTGHFGATITGVGIVYHLTSQEATSLFDLLSYLGVGFLREFLGVLALGVPAALAYLQNKYQEWVAAGYGLGGYILMTMFTNLVLMIADAAVISAVIGFLAAGLAGLDYLYGSQGVNVFIGVLGIMFLPPTVERQHSLWVGDKKICDCEMPMISDLLIRYIRD